MSVSLAPALLAALNLLLPSHKQPDPVCVCVCVCVGGWPMVVVDVKVWA